MPMLDFSPARKAPFDHQRIDTQALLDNPYYFITSEMRTGKTKIVIDAAQFMFILQMIRRVIVVAPAPVRSVWYPQKIGQLWEHLWDGMFADVIEYHDPTRQWHWRPDGTGGRFERFRLTPMQWIVTNYEFIRAQKRLAELLPFCDAQTFLVLDESSFIKNYDADQTEACMALRKACGRVVLLNGTPISHSPLDLFSQGNLLHPSILDCRYITHFKAKYSIQEQVIGKGGKPLTTPRGHAIKKITGWVHLDELTRRFAPYTVLRLQSECLDLPPKLDPVALTATLTPATWRLYKSMRDDLVVWLDSGDVSTAVQAATKVLRLSQITSGLLAGIEAANIEKPPTEDFFDSLQLEGTDGEEFQGVCSSDVMDNRAAVNAVPATIQEIGREKLDVVLWLLAQRLEQYPNLHIVVWCRFRHELFRMLTAVAEKFPQFEMGSIVGAQKRAARLHAMALLKPETSPKGPVFVGGTFGTGSYGLNFTAANHSVNCSFDYSLGKYKQSGDRVYGPGMIGPASYFNILATGPKGQKTIDHVMVEARQNNENIADITAKGWIRRLMEE